MSAIPTDIGFREPARESGRESTLSRSASVYFWVVVAAGLAVTLPFLSRLSPHTHGWATFAILATGVAVAQLFVVVTPGHQSYHTTGGLPASRSVPPAARARRADGVRPARAGLAEAPPAVPHPGVQHRELHARHDGERGRSRTRSSASAPSTSTAWGRCSRASRRRSSSSG